MTKAIFACKQCGYSQDIDPVHIGSVFSCPTCATVVAVTAIEEPAPMPAQAKPEPPGGTTPNQPGAQQQRPIAGSQVIMPSQAVNASSPQQPAAPSAQAAPEQQQRPVARSQVIMPSQPVNANSPQQPAAPSVQAAPEQRQSPSPSPQAPSAEKPATQAPQAVSSQQPVKPQSEPELPYLSMDGQYPGQQAVTAQAAGISASVQSTPPGQAASAPRQEIPTHQSVKSPQAPAASPQQGFNPAMVAFQTGAVASPVGVNVAPSHGGIPTADMAAAVAAFEAASAQGGMVVPQPEARRKKGSVFGNVLVFAILYILFMAPYLLPYLESYNINGLSVLTSGSILSPFMMRAICSGALIITALLRGFAIDKFWLFLFPACATALDFIPNLGLPSFTPTVLHALTLALGVLMGPKKARKLSL